MRVDVVTASRHESTAEIGAAIAGRLAERGHDARALDAAELERLEPEVAVVLGSAIYMGRWLKPARRLAERLAEEDGSRRLWMFSVGPLGDPPKPDEPEPEAEPEEEVRRIAAEHALEHRVLSGRLDRSRLKRRERLAVRAAKAPEGDFRDWVEIEAWADEIAAALDA